MKFNENPLIRYIYIYIYISELIVAFRSFAKARQVLLLARLTVTADSVCSLEAA